MVKKRGYLKDARVYLSGPMDFVASRAVFLPLTYVRGSVTRGINCGGKYFFLRGYFLFAEGGESLTIL